MKFKDAKKLIDEYFASLTDEDIIAKATAFGLNVKRVESVDEAGFFPYVPDDTLTATLKRKWKGIKKGLLQ